MYIFNSKILFFIELNIYFAQQFINHVSTQYDDVWQLKIVSFALDFSSSKGHVDITYCLFSMIRS